MSRHAAPDEDPSQEPPISDTGPLFLGHGDWPPLRPQAPAASPKDLSSPTDPYRHDRDDRGGDSRAAGNGFARGGTSEPDDGHAHATTPVPWLSESREPEDQSSLGSDADRRTVDGSAEEDPHPEDPHPEDPHPEDPHPEDLHPEDLHPEDLHPEDLHPEDLHPEDLHPEDLPADDPADELGLLPAAPVEGGHRRGRRTAAPVRKVRRPLAILVSLGVIAALVTGIFFGGKAIVDLISTDPAADYSGQGGDAVQIEVPDGASTTQIADVLFESDVVASSEAFLDAASANPDILTIQPGVYQLREQMSAEAAVALILDPAARLFERATIPEGYTVARTLESLSEQTDIPLADFEAARAAPDQLGLPAWSNGQLEGFLFPATYDIGPDVTAVQVLSDMVARFNEVAIQTDLEASAANVGLTPYELLTVSSMVQSEVTVERERPLVARVIYNRLDQGIQLGIDATLAYELGIGGDELTTAQLETDSPYNTRTRLGLPPTPISNPGELSITGALNPSPGDYLYYVLQNSDGEHLFTASYAEFLAAKAACEAAGLGCG